MGNKFNKNKLILMRAFIALAIIVSASAISWKVPAGGSVTINNPLPIAFNTQCTIECTGTNKISASSSKGTTDITLAFSSTPIVVYVYNGLDFSIAAAAGDTAVFTNNGANSVSAECDSGAENWTLAPGVATNIANPVSGAWNADCSVTTTDAEDATSITGPSSSSLSTSLAVGTHSVGMDVSNGSALGIKASKGGAAL